MQLTERQAECVEAYRNCNESEIEASRLLGIDVKTLRNNLWLAHKKGVNFSPDTFVEQAPAGFGLTKSTLHIKDGEVIQRWDRVSPYSRNEEAIFDYLRSRVPLSKYKPLPVVGNDSLQLEWTLADYHYGLLAWDKETGDDYDLNIARELLLDSATEIFSRTGRVKETVLVLLGDNFHSDFKSNHTERSNHPLDVDTRYPKIVFTGVETFITAIEICLQYSERVKVIVLYGNHDEHTSVNLQYMLHFYFRGISDRVTVDLSPAKEHYNFWGCVGTIYHHGDTTKPARICGELMQYIARNDITGIRYFYAKQAHLHRESTDTINGVKFEVVPSPVGRDSFASSHNYMGVRATVATLYDKEYGEVARHSIFPSGLALKKSKINS